MNRTVLLLLFGTALSCNDTDRPAIDVPQGDSFVFATEVQAYVGLGCGSLDCHGDRGRALQIFAKFGLREADALRARDVSGTEVVANVAAFAALGEATPEEHLALQKALAVSAGGLAHVGGDIWADTTAPGYQCVRAYLAGTTDPAACAAALAELE